MSNVLIEENTMTDIANAIREKTETTDKMKPAEMSKKILDIQSGGNSDGLPKNDGKTWIKVIYPSKYVTNSEFKIYLNSTKGNSPVYVDWGDGTEVYQTTATARQEATHTYEETGIYYISIWSEEEYCLGYVNNACINLISYVLELEIGKNVALLQSAFANATRLLAIYNSKENVWRPHDIGQVLFKNRLVPSVELLGLKVDGTGSQCGLAMFNGASVMKLTLGEYVTGLPSSFCLNSTSLREFNATENLKQINASAFSGCTGLAKVLLPSKELVTLSATSAFTNVPTTCKIYVPDDLVEDYKLATNWVDFADMITPISELEA